MKVIKKIILITLIFTVLSLGLLYFIIKLHPKETSINSFKDCWRANYTVTDTYPRECNTPNKHFVDDIGNSKELMESILVKWPVPGGLVGSPLIIVGKARENWFFNGQFGVRILDADGNEIGRSVANIKENPGDDEFIPFVAYVDFDDSKQQNATLILESINPSKPDLRLHFPVEIFRFNF